MPPNFGDWAHGGDGKTTYYADGRWYHDVERSDVYDGEGAGVGEAEEGNRDVSVNDEHVSAMHEDVSGVDGSDSGRVADEILKQMDVEVSGREGASDLNPADDQVAGWMGGDVSEQVVEEFAQRVPEDVFRPVADEVSRGVVEDSSRLKPKVGSGQMARDAVDNDPDDTEGQGLRAAVLDHAVFDPADPRVKGEILRAIVQYLQDEGYSGSSVVVQDETNVKLRNAAGKRGQMRRMRRAILEGEWSEVDKLLSKTTFKNKRAFRYAVYRQQYLELVDAQENQKAFSILGRRLKELEAYAQAPDEFRDMCYLLTCKSVTEATSFRDWDGVGASRAALVEQYSRLLDFDAFQKDGLAAARGDPAQQGQGSVDDVPPGRLLHLLQQAVAFQIGSSRYKPRAPPKIGTILEDFECVVVPNTRHHEFRGHTGNVKCVTFVGEEGCSLATGSSDDTVRIWDTAAGTCKAVLSGHRSRIWDVSATANGSMLASCSGDGTICLWDTSQILSSAVMKWSAHSEMASGFASDSHYSHQLRLSNSRLSGNGAWNHGAFASQIDGRTSHELQRSYAGSAGGTPGASVPSSSAPRLVLRGHTNDVYTVRFHPRGNTVVSGGFDKCVRLYDAETGSILRTFTGHKSSVSCIAFNARGNMIITGSKDSTIRYWDIISGLCIKTVSSHLGEVTSVETNGVGTLLLSSSKDNSNRLWDLRMNKAIRRFKGHQNTSKNFIRTGFGPRESLVIGGSEDGFVYIWDVETTDVVAKLGPANGPVYGAKWNARQSLLASCSHDGAVTTWSYKPVSSGKA